jgi:hypothetical protein
MASEGKTIELDTLERWRERSRESFGAAMDLLDAGFRNGGSVTKMVTSGKSEWRRESYPVFTPYAMAGIRKESLSDTALDRAFAVEMRRKSTKERKARYNFQKCEERCRPVRERLYAWALQHAKALSLEYESAALDSSLTQLGLNDRAADIWKPLLAIAIVLELPERARQRVEALAKDMGGDPEVVEDERRLKIAEILQSHASEKDESTLTEMTGGLVSLLGGEGIEIGKADLHGLLEHWRFVQKNVRVPAGPRRCWVLRENALARIAARLRSEMVGIPPQNTDYNDYAG